MSDIEFIISETSSMVNLEEYLNYLTIERCNEIYSKIISQDGEYQDLQARIESCFKALLQVLPESAQKEIMTETLWGIISKLEILIPRHTYKQALKDGFRVKAWVEAE